MTADAAKELDAAGKRETMPKEYIIYCDESVAKGAHFSNFYGGALVDSDHLDEVRAALATAKSDLNLNSEVKWQKITESYKQKYVALMDVFFDLMSIGKIKLRIMFTQNMFAAVRLTSLQKEEGFFILYYQFIKHAFGLRYHPRSPIQTNIRLLLDQLPNTKERSERFKGYLSALSRSSEFRAARLILVRENIVDVESHQHPILQCLDVVLGSMQFRLNDKHREIPEGKVRRAKRTRAKEHVYRHINLRIRQLHPGFNVGITTGIGGAVENRWHHSYRHWRFIPTEHEVVGSSKRKK